MSLTADELCTRTVYREESISAGRQKPAGRLVSAPRRLAPVRSTGQGLAPPLAASVRPPEGLLVDEGAKEEPEGDQAQEDRDQVSESGMCWPPL